MGGLESLGGLENTISTCIYWQCIY